MHRIMVVDDETIITMQLEKRLTSMGYEVSGAAFSGESAVDMAQRLRPDLILMDIVMPGQLDGIDAAEAIKAEQDIPVIFLTAYTDEQFIERAKHVEPFGYIVKPYHERELKAAIEVALYKKEVEQRLRESEERFRTVADFTYDWEYWIGPDGNHIYVSPSCERITGYGVDEFLNNPALLEAITHPDDRPIISRHFQEELESDEVLHYDFRIITRSGRESWISHFCQPAYSADGRFLGRRVSNRDTTKRKWAEEALRKSEERFKEMADLLPTVLCEMDMNLQVTYTNKIALETFGCSQDDIDVGINAMDWVHPDDREKAEKHIKRIIDQGVKFDSVEYRILSKDGSEIVALVTCAPMYRDGKLVGIRASMIDITEQKRLEARLLEARKMEAIATLAGGIAHDFNNALSVVNRNIELLKMDLADHENIDGYVESMLSSVRRMADLTNQFLAYAGGGKYTSKNISLSDFVKDIVPLIQRTIDPLVRVEKDLPDDISNIEADLTQMQMVLLAVIENAAEAIEGPGCIKITTRNEEIDEEFAEHHADLKPGRYVCLTAEDDGKGMDEKTRTRIFEPFFTTKCRGRGLGMAAVYGIVKNHGGWISVDSELGKGTVCHVYLPAVEGQAKEAKEQKTELARGRGTILVVQGQEGVMNTTRAILERVGYCVLGANSGMEAINIAKTFDGDIDLAILDIQLPDMRGKSAYTFIKDARPNLKVIVCSML